MLTDSMYQWIDKCVRSQRAKHQDYCVCVSRSTTHLSVACLARGWTCVVLGICGTRVRSRVSNDIDRDQQAQRCGQS